MALVNAFGDIALDASVQGVAAAVAAVESDVEALVESVADLYATQQDALTELQAIKVIMQAILDTLQVEEPTP